MCLSLFTLLLRFRNASTTPLTSPILFFCADDDVVSDSDTSCPMSYRSSTIRSRNCAARSNSAIHGNTNISLW